MPLQKGIEMVARAKEHWKRCKVDKWYLVSSWGRVYSMIAGHLLTPELVKSRCDYYYRMNFPECRIMLHMLVAYHFKNKDKLKLEDILLNKDIQVNHLNLNTLDCAADNVEFCTQSENINHSLANRKLSFNGFDYILKRRKDE